MQTFGGRWTVTKLDALRYYLDAYVTALRGKWGNLLYIDAFAGSGGYTPSRGDGQPQMGSASIALEADGFTEYQFIELSKSRCEALRSLKDRFPDKRISIVEGDANQYLARLCVEPRWRRTRGVLFLDPFGMHVSWETLLAVARTGAIDVWYLFPLNAVMRQMARDPEKVDAAKARSLDRLFGTGEWREEFYATGATDMFGTATTSRVANEGLVLQWFKARLAEHFSVVEGPEILHIGSKSSAYGGPPLFALFFLASTKNTGAQALARRLANGVITRLQREALVGKPVREGGALVEFELGPPGSE